MVLMFMNQITESSKISNPRVDLNRVRMTLVRTSEGWKASAVDALEERGVRPSPGREWRETVVGGRGFKVIL